MKTNINKVTSKEAWKAALEEKEYGTVWYGGTQTHYIICTVLVYVHPAQLQTGHIGTYIS